MVESFASGTGSFNCDREVFFDLSLPDELGKPLRTQLQLERRIVLNRSRRDDALAVLRKFGSVSERGHWPDVTTKVKGAEQLGGLINGTVVYLCHIIYNYILCL